MTEARYFLSNCIGAGRESSQECLAAGAKILKSNSSGGSSALAAYRGDGVVQYEGGRSSTVIAARRSILSRTLRLPRSRNS